MEMRTDSIGRRYNAHKNKPHHHLQQTRRNWVLNYKKDKSCANCGWNEHTEILQFHHVKIHPSNIAISKFILKKVSPSEIKVEIKKCILLCPNCHVWHHRVYGRPSWIKKKR